MPRVIINTVGISALPGFFNENPIKDILEQAVKSESAKEKLFSEAKKYFQERVVKNKHDIGKISAEINCLNKIKAEAGDFLFFLVSDTPDGEICGKLLVEFCQEYFKPVACQNYTIPGLQVKDAQLFEREGLNNFLDKVLDIMDRYQGYEIIFNPNGGFKAVVPYTTLLGLVFNISTYYIFERSGQVIKLPAAPVDFDLKILANLSPVIGDIRNDYQNVDEFLQETGLTRDQLSELAGAIVVEEEQVTLSPLGRLLYERYLRQKGYTFKLSDQVEKKLSSGRYPDKKFRDIFEKMTDPVHLTNKLHNEIKGKNVDLDCYKGGNTNERIFYYMQDRIIMICDIFMHDEYERELKKGKIIKASYNFTEGACRY